MVLWLILLLPVAHALDLNALPGQPVVWGNNPSKCFVFFTKEGCPHCAKVLPHVKEWAKEYTFIVYEITVPDNLPVLSAFAREYNFPEAVPVIVSDSGVLVGDRQILEEFNALAEAAGCSILFPKEKEEGGGILIVILTTLAAVVIIITTISRRG